jgi:hypothetical protein
MLYTRFDNNSGDNKDTAINAGKIAGFGLGLIVGAGSLATLGALIVVAHPVVVGIIAVAAIMLAANAMSLIAGKIAGAAYSFFRPTFPTNGKKKPPAQPADYDSESETENYTTNGKKKPSAQPADYDSKDYDSKDYDSKDSDTDSVYSL